MAKNSKVIKKRISSIRNTKKITRSMQMIAAAKMQKTVKAALQSKMYTQLGMEVLAELSKVSGIDHALLEERTVKNELLVIVSSNRGLCGNYNANVIAKANKYLKNYPKDQKLSVLAIGRKAAGFAKRNGLNLVALYEHISESPTAASILPITDTALKGFVDEEYDKVSMIYTDYKSSFSQTVMIKVLLPMNKIELEESGVKIKDNAQEEELKEDAETCDYKMEPGSEELLNYILPRMMETQTYQAILESAASEHSSRMIAMKNATDSATDMIYGLTLEYNKSRQAVITQEVAEIIGGIDALAEEEINF